MEELRLRPGGTRLAAGLARLVLNGVFAAFLSGCAVLSRTSEAPEPVYRVMGEHWEARRNTVDRSRCADSAKVCDFLNATHYCRCVPN